MAKWGQGDPRWIVEERADATNVNNWHWTEKDASEWSKTLLKELFRGLKIEDGDAKCQTTDVSKVEGEASVNNRKAKTIVFYEWTVTIDWKGTLNDDDVPIRGTIEIPNLSEEIAVEDLEVIVKVKTDSDDGWKLKEMIRKSGAEIIRKTAGCYIEKLKTEFSQGLQLPRHQSSEAAKAGKMSSAGSVISDAFKSGASVRSKQGSSPGSVGYIIATKKIVLNTDFKTTANELYLTLTSRERLEAFTQGPVEIEATKGGRFSLLGGNVTGEFRELIRDTRIVQTWRYSNWPDGHYSTVRIELQQTEDNTKLKLTQSGVPESEAERTRQGWNRYYFQSMKRTFGYGAQLM